ARLLRLGIGDVAATHPRQDFRRRSPWHRRRAWRPVAEFFFELVRSPARSIATIGGDVRQLRVPAHALVRIGRLNRMAVPIDPSKLAFGEDDRIGTPLRQKATMSTCFATSAQSTALAAFD